MREKKQRILDHLLEALRETQYCEDLKSLTYLTEEEKVIAVFESGARVRVNVAGDSGWGMIKDVLAALA